MKRLWGMIMRLHRWCNGHEWILILVLAVIIFRLPSLVTPHFYGDEEIYFVMGRAWREGVPIYEAMFDHKPPLIYVLAGIFGTVPLFRGMLLAMMVLHTVLFWMLSKKFWGSDHPWLTKLSTLIFVVLSTVPTFEGLIVNAELLMMIPVTASLLMIWDLRADSGVRPYRVITKYLLAGLVAGIGWLYKIPVMFDVVAIGLFLFVFAGKTIKESLRNIFRLNFWAYFVGFALPLLFTFVYYFAKGHGQSYLATVFTVNLGYVSSWSSNSFTTFNPFKSGLVVRGTLLAIFTLGLYVVRNKVDRRIILAALWSGFALFGALLSYRPYPHYLQELVPAISLLIPTIFLANKVGEWIIIAVLIAAGIMTQRDVSFWGYPTVGVYRDFWQLVTKKMSREKYFDRFDNTSRNYQIGKYLNEHLLAEDKIYVWGSDPTIYNLTNRLPTGGKYIVSFHVRDLMKYDYVIENLNKVEPKAIVWIVGATPFPELSTLIETKYVEAYRIQDNIVYWKIEK